MAAVDPGRVRRALTLDVERIGDREYLVTGGAEPHVVEGQTCACTDSRFHAGPCKHRLSVHLYRQLNPAVLEALRIAADTDEGNVITSQEV